MHYAVHVQNKIRKSILYKKNRSKERLHTLLKALLFLNMYAWLTTYQFVVQTTQIILNVTLLIKLSKKTIQCSIINVFVSNSCLNNA